MKKFLPVDAQGPKVPGENVDYRLLKDEGIDTALEMSVTEIGFETPPETEKFDKENPPLYLSVTAEARLVRLTDGQVLYDPKLTVSSGPLTRAEWEFDNSKAFFEYFNRECSDIADKVVDDIFITYIRP